jgi:putative alpha-1,2-mannosidase
MISCFKYLAFFLLTSAAASAQSLLQYVDPLIGTAPASTPGALRNSNTGSEEKGQTFPGVGRPFGMTQWTPETRTTKIKCISPYYYNDKFITGFRGSHWMSGSCTQNYGSLTIMPFFTDYPDTIRKSPVSSYIHEKETSTPAYYSVLLDDYIYQGRGESAGFGGWFVILFDKEYNVMNNGLKKQNMVLSFGDEKTVCAFIGTSFTSRDEAMKNLIAEVPGLNFEYLRRSSEDEWNKVLGKIEVKGGNEADKVKFYTALHHYTIVPLYHYTSAPLCP